MNRTQTYGEINMTKTVLITGTSSGYGKATAEHFLDQGWNVVATMRTPDSSVFGAASDRLKVVALDVTDASSIQDAIENAIESFGRIDVLVNNAGIGLASAVEVTPDVTMREVFETNTFGVFIMCRALIPLMRKQKGGTIINVTSSASIAPMPLVAIYTASKAAVDGFTESLSYELAPFGIRARAVAPGYAPSTNFTANGGPRMEGLIPDSYGVFAHSYFQKMANYPTDYCHESEVAEAVFEAATDSGRQVRFLAGEDTKMVANLRWETSEEHYLAKMRQMFEPS